MKLELLTILCCPKTKNKLFIEGKSTTLKDIEFGSLVTEDRKYFYPIERGVPRFAEESNYADNFGMQWNLYSKTQLEWSLLDTFDWFSPQHDYPQTSKIAKLWMENAQLYDIEVFRSGHLVARGRKK